MFGAIAAIAFIFGVIVGVSICQGLLWQATNLHEKVQELSAQTNANLKKAIEALEDLERKNVV